MIEKLYFYNGTNGHSKRNVALYEHLHVIRSCKSCAIFHTQGIQTTHPVAPHVECDYFETQI